jgi:hypothetical protein
LERSASGAVVDCNRQCYFECCGEGVMFSVEKRQLGRADRKSRQNPAQSARLQTEVAGS